MSINQVSNCVAYNYKTKQQFSDIRYNLQKALNIST